jgi:hypothetical protein
LAILLLFLSLLPAFIRRKKPLAKDDRTQ